MSIRRKHIVGLSAITAKAFFHSWATMSSYLETANTLSPFVRAIETQDGAVLLDIRQGLCISINTIGSRIWAYLREGRTFEEIINCLVEQFPSVPCELIRNDSIEFVGKLKENGLMHSHELRSRSRDLMLPRFQSMLVCRLGVSRHHLLLLKALVGLLEFDLLGFGSDFYKTYSFVQQWPLSRATPEPTVTSAVCGAVNYACLCYPKRVLCLQRSAITTCLLRSCGVQAQMVIGAQKLPFRAHAWTEVGGQPINERRNVTRFYQTWDRC